MTITELVIAAVWAAAAPLSGRETDRAQQLAPTATYRFTIRNRAGLNEHDWIVWQGERYNIRAILTNGRRDLYLDIDAERGVAD